MLSLWDGSEITFEISGPGKIIGVGNGDPGSHEPDCYVTTDGNPSPQWKRSLFNGIAQVIVQSTGDAGEIRLTANSGGLKSASVILKSEAVSQLPSAP